jgi:general secretion pathway protein D
MRRLAAILVLFSSAAWVQSAPQSANPGLEQLQLCAQQPTPATCGVSKRELQQGKRDFARGLKLQKAGKSAEAFDVFDAAARVVPRNLEYATVREVVLQKLVYEHVQKGNSLLLGHKDIAAAAEFRQALQLDPSNSFALQRLADAAALKPLPGPHKFQVQDDPGELRLQPQNDSRQDFHVRGDTRAVYEAIGKAFGVAPQFDETVVSRPLRFDLEDADFQTAIRLAGLMSKSSWTPLSGREFLVFADNAQNRARFERMSLRTFFVPDAATPQDLTEIVNVLRSVFEIRYITTQAATSTLVVRAPRPILDAATFFLASLDQSRPQVMLDFQVYEVSRSLMRSFGLTLPLQWQTFSLNSAALAALQQPNVQNAINQLIASGGINAANTTAIAALLAQLQSQSQNPLLQQPFATFGGGQTLTAVAVPPISVNFSRNESQVSSLQHMTLRASHGSPATMRIGARYPILNSTFAPIYNSPAIAQVLQNNTFVAPFPSFNYEDLGLIVKATPQIHGSTDVRLELSIEVKALSAQSVNGVPVISNRAYTGTISIKDGEAGVIAGMLDVEEQNTLTGLPGAARLPLLGTLTSSHGKQKTSTELIIVITPDLTRTREASPPAIMIPTS